MKSSVFGLPSLLLCLVLPFSLLPCANCDAACTAAPSGIVSWWPGESNALDVVGVNDGTLQNGASFAPGMIGASFNLNGARQLEFGFQ